MAYEGLASRLKELADRLVKQMVKDPAAVRVAAEMDERAGVVQLDIQVAHEDMGRILGKGGSHARSLRTLFQAVARVHGGSCDTSLTGRGER